MKKLLLLTLLVAAIEVACVAPEDYWLLGIPVGKEYSLDQRLQSDNVESVYFFEQNTKVAQMAEVFPNINKKAFGETFGVHFVLKKADGTLQVRWINTYREDVQIIFHDGLQSTFLNPSRILLSQPSQSRFEISLRP